jgi:hypothetical protein
MAGGSPDLLADSYAPPSAFISLKLLFFDKEGEFSISGLSSFANSLNVYVRFCASLVKNCWGWLTHTDRE